MKKLLATVFLMVAGCAQPQEIVFRSGDIVQLKSGGPTMTVVRDVYNDGSVPVEWMDHLGQPNYRIYYQSQIIKIER